MTRRGAMAGSLGRGARVAVALAAIAGGGLVAHLVAPAQARAQSATAGAIQGVIIDQRTGEPLAGVTVTVVSPALQGAQTAITDDRGSYKISPLPPGDYAVTFYFIELRVERRGVSVGVNRVTPVYQRLDLARAGGGETVRILDSAPAIDPGSTTQGIALDPRYLAHIPLPGRTYAAAVGAAAGGQADGAGGVGFAGSTSLENQYYVDGLNTTGLTFGGIGTPVPNDFIEEIEVVTGGYPAEMGRATGGLVNVVTKTGSNQLRGSIFGTLQPGQLTARPAGTPIEGSAIDVVSDVAFAFDLGFELGGPIVRDRLWFFVGVAPQVTDTDLRRSTKRKTDCRLLQPDGTLSRCAPELADGQPDRDPATGRDLTDTLDSEARRQRERAVSVLGKLNVAATPEHQGQLAVQLLPARTETPGVFAPAANGRRVASLTSDVSAKWTSKLDAQRTELELVVGWHRDHRTSDPRDAALANRPAQELRNGNLFTWGTGFASESAATLRGCEDGGPDDPYPGIENCPMDTRGYAVGGPGAITDDTEQRRAARVGVTHRVRALGHHELKAGLDIEDNRTDKSRLYSGGALIRNDVRGGFVAVHRFVQLLGPEGSAAVRNNTDARYDNSCSTTGGTAYVCDWIAGTLGGPGTTIDGNTTNWSAYLRDSWQVLPQLTVNLGLRYEEQRMRYSDALQGQVDPLTQSRLGTNAMTLTGLFAPRIGVVYDATREGRSKLYAHAGRFYESIPMDINDRAFGGETVFRQLFARGSCASGGMTTATTDPAIGGANGELCVPENNAAGDFQELIGASGTLVAPGIRSQYLDEVLAGADYELFDDLVVGVAYHHRRLGRVIEDVSTDGAETYIIANPGEWSADEERALEARIARTDAADARAVLERQLALFRGIRSFDKPSRGTHALQLTATRRFSPRLYVRGAYTYRRVEGNYGGLYSADNGQIDPNISSQYDLIELLANRRGALPQDRPHELKLDGSYQHDLGRWGDVAIGARIRGQSGIPTNALAAHYAYGPNESFLLPRGQLGRTRFEHAIDLRLGWGKALTRTTRLELFIDVFNLYNAQSERAVDDTYAPAQRLSADGAPGAAQNANPVSGGSYEDLIFVKTIDQAGLENPTPIGRNPNFRNTTSRYAPAYARLGARLSF